MSGGYDTESGEKIDSPDIYVHMTYTMSFIYKTI